MIKGYGSGAVINTAQLVTCVGKVERPAQTIGDRAQGVSTVNQGMDIAISVFDSGELSYCIRGSCIDSRGGHLDAVNLDMYRAVRAALCPDQHNNGCHPGQIGTLSETGQVGKRVLKGDW